MSVYEGVTGKAKTIYGILQKRACIAFLSCILGKKTALQTLQN